VEEMMSAIAPAMGGGGGGNSMGEGLIEVALSCSGTTGCISVDLR
jgi:hypothetical protein